ncbi:MAG TPA: helix-turn-helix transcriptional regulator [Myxococcales bacterium]|jgi:transcriptional regulator with XRE-family HTH domain
MKKDHEVMMAELAQAVGRRVRELRLARPAPESTLTALSRRAGMSVSFLSMIENGHRLPSLGALVALSRALETPPANLLEVADQLPVSEVPPGDGPDAELPDDLPPDPVPGAFAPPAPAATPSAAELLEPVATFFRARGLGERELSELLEAARTLFS